MQPDSEVVILSPGPGDTVLAGSRIAIIVGVSADRARKPSSTKVEVQVHYSINGGADDIVAAEWKNTDGEVEYFEARINALWAGDSVECYAEYRLKDAPDDEAARSASSSFRVIDAREKIRPTSKTTARQPLRASASSNLERTSSSPPRSPSGPTLAATLSGGAQRFSTQPVPVRSIAKLAPGSSQPAGGNGRSASISRTAPSLIATGISPSGAPTESHQVDRS